MWLNLAHVSRISVLIEDTNLLPFETQGVGPSKLHAVVEKGEDLAEIKLNVNIWTGAEKEPLEVCEISGDDWMEIATSFDCKKQFFVVTDEDGEQLAVAIDDLNMLIGTETARYSEALLETVQRELFANSSAMPE